MFSLERFDSDSPNTSYLCPSLALEARLSQAEVDGDRSMPDPELSCCLGSCMLRSPNRLAMKCRDPKTNH
jgi:hypothetical protein